MERYFHLHNLRNSSQCSNKNFEISVDILDNELSAPVDTTSPNISIDQAIAQADPTNSATISYTVIFDEAINPATFNATDITTGGTATGVIWSAPTTSDNITWTIQTTAVATDGSIIPTIASGVVQDIAGNNNTASTSLDNIVTFDSNSGSDVDSQTIIEGHTVIKPTNPTKTNYTFINWYSDTELTTLWDFNTDIVNTNMILYAEWQIAIDKTEMVSVTGGTFTQSESFNHTISDFSIGKYEVTYELWNTVYTWANNNGYSFANAGKEGHDGTIGADPTAAKYEPVTAINWRDTIVWCNAYSEKSGRTPACQ